MKKKLFGCRFWLMSTLGLIAASCSSKYRTTEKEGAQKYYNLKYGAHKQQRMDVFLPASYAPENPAWSSYTWRLEV